MANSSFETLVQVAERLTDIKSLGHLEPNDLAAAPAFLERNRSVIEAARSALGPECSVTLRYDAAFLNEQCQRFEPLRQLACAFRAEGLLAVADAQYSAAVRPGIALVELSNAVRRGGLIIDLLISIGIADLGLELLANVRAHLDGVARRMLVQELQRLEAEREPFEDIAERDLAWEMVVWGGKEQPSAAASELPIRDPAECGLSEEQQRERQQLMDEVDQLQLHAKLDACSFALMRMLDIDLALRSWHEAQQSFPGNLSALAPEFLPTIPLDPYTNQSFLYRRVSSSEFLLYSTGPKRFDGGGRFADWPSVSAGLADLCIDVASYSTDACFTIPQPQNWWRRTAAGVKRWLGLS
ncbi:MAG: hypothetical protein ACTHK7_19030 [Aureliella sp.]